MAMIVRWETAAQDCLPRFGDAVAREHALDQRVLPAVTHP